MTGNYLLITLLLFVYIIPTIMIVQWVDRQNKRSDEEYRQKIKEIESRYGVKE